MDAVTTIAGHGGGGVQGADAAPEGTPGHHHDSCCQGPHHGQVSVPGLEW